MAKTIKFNLICNGNPIRKIEDLQNNFSIEDVLGYYNTKLLHRWLEVRGYTNELEKVSRITREKPLEIIKELIRVFNIESDEKKVAENVYMLEYIEGRKELLSMYDDNNFNAKSIVDDFYKQYSDLINSIIKNKEDMPYLKVCGYRLAGEFFNIFNTDYYNIINRFFLECPMMVYAMLTNKILRGYLLVSELPIDSDDFRVDRVNEITEVLLSDDFFSPIKLDKILKNNVHKVVGKTDDYWKDVEPSNKKIMVIRAGKNVRVRSAGKTGEEYLQEYFMGKFLILDGLDYKLNLDNSYMIYMEV